MTTHSTLFTFPTERAIEERKDETVQGYASKPDWLADLCAHFPMLGIAIFRHVLEQVDGIEVHIEKLIEADRGAMERITIEAQEWVAKQVEIDKDNAAEYAAMCREDAA